MDSINSIHDSIVKNLRNENRIVTVSKLFTEFETDRERYELGSLLLDEFDIAPEVDEPCFKSAFESEKLRNEGNSAFLKRQDLNAIQCYTSSAGYAPNESKELALSYANRSAVTFALKQFDDCLKDIDRALNGHYPDNLKYKLYERKGKCLKYLGDKVSAKENYRISLEWVTKSNLSVEKQASFNESLNLALSDLELVDNVDVCKNSDDERTGSQLQLSFPPNDEILCACDALKIEYSEQFGRHVVATKDILPGQILAIERPFASILLPSAYKEYCFHCLKRCHSLLPCSGCTKVFFCSTTCREVSWREYHCIDCSLLERLYNFGCSNLEILSVRTLILAARVDKFSEVIKLIDGITANNEVDPCKIGYNEQGKYDSEDYRTSHFLARNTELRTPADLFRRVIFAVCAIHFINRYTDFFEINSPPAAYDDANPGNVPLLMRCHAGGLLLRYMQIIPCNGHEVSEMCVTLGVAERNNNGQSEGSQEVSANQIVDSNCLKRSTSYFDYACNEIGSALYPFLSLINHACDPNVVRHSYNGDKVVLSAIQGIRKGQQILDSYSHHYALHDITTRRSQLFQQYHFNCACIACTDNWPLFNDLPEELIIKDSLKEEVMKSTEEFQAVYEKVLKGDFEGKLPTLLNHLALLDRAVARPCKEYNQCQEAIKMCQCLRTNHYMHSNL